LADIQLRDIQLHYEERGEGLPMLLINGTASFAEVWGKAVDDLAGKGRVIIYDRRGCTRSERPDPYITTSVHDHSRDAGELLRALGAEPAIVIGRSYGGGVALDLALRSPGSVVALVLLEPAVIGMAPEADKLLSELRDSVNNAAQEKGPGAAAEGLLRAVLGDQGWESFPPATQEMFSFNSPAVLAELNGELLRVEAGELGRVSQPVLLVSAETSPEGFRKANDALVAALPNARHLVIEGGHLISPSDPGVLQFIDQVLATTKLTEPA
jgi:esterase